MKGRAAWLGLAVMAAVISIALVGCAAAPSGSTVKQDSWDPEAQQLYMDSQGGGR
jgi:hypothetical protein